MLFGIVRQGLKCSGIIVHDFLFNYYLIYFVYNYVFLTCTCCYLGCNLNYHKKCVVKLLNDCGVKNNSKLSTINLNISPRNPSNASLTSTVSDETVWIIYNFKLTFII